MKVALKVDFLYLNFIFWFRFAYIPVRYNTDPDPAWRFESGFIQIRNTATCRVLQLRHLYNSAHVDSVVF